MDIYLLRNGEQTGPFPEGEVQSLLKTGGVTLDDFAWRDGLATWQPLHAVLYPKSATQKILPLPPADAPMPTPEPFLSPAAEPATPRQKAFLTYLGIDFSGDVTRERAAVLLNDAAEDPKHAARSKRWDEEKLRLHPELFAEEIKARKESRSQHFLHVCEADGADFFHDVTKAHAQVLVGYLDVQHPHWDEHPDANRYFFAALAEKFPQLVKAGAKAQLKFPDGPKAGTAMERSGVAVRSRRKRSPLAAAARGMGIGLLMLAALYGVHAFYEKHIATLGADAASAALPDVPLPPAPTPPVTLAEVHAEPPPAPAPTPEPLAQMPPVATPEPVPAPAPTAPAPDAAPLVAMTVTPSPTPATTMPEAPTAIAMDATPAPAPIPLFEPTTSATPAPATPAPRTSVKITKATPVTLRFGSSTLPAGAVVSVVKVNGENVLVRFGPDVIAVPIAHTDLASTLPPE